MGLTQSGNYAIMSRDLEVLRSLARMRYLKTSQIERLHFPSLRVTNRRLEVLTDHGYIDRFRLPMILGQGSSEYVSCLNEKGSELLSELECDEIHGPKRNGRPKNFVLMEHLLGINDFWIALEAACLRAGLRLVTFLPEYYGTRTEHGGFRRLIADSTVDPDNASEPIDFTPDAVFMLERNAKQALFFLEIDRGTEKISSNTYAAFMDKLRAYAGYRRTEGFKRWGQQFTGFRVLVTTPSDQRLQNLLSAAKGTGVEKLFWFSNCAQITTDSILREIWLVPGREGAQALIRM